MAGKKWCQYCRINLPYDKKAIQQHEATRLHIQNKQKHIKFQRIKIQREQKLKRQASKANSFTSTANIPKAKKGTQLQKQVQDYRNDVMMSGKMAIHQSIAEKTRGLYGAPIQYPEKEDLVLAQNYIDQEDNDGNQENDQDASGSKFQMWKIDICQQTGKACFINKISQAKLYEPPKGYIMSQQQKQQWQQTKRICDQIPDENLQQIGQIGKWQQVAEEQDYFQINKAEPEQQPVFQAKPLSNIKIEDNSKFQIKRQQNNVKNQVEKRLQQISLQKKSWMDSLHQRIQKNQVSESQVIGTVLTNTLKQCRTVKQKNQALKKLVKNDFQIRATLNHHDQQLLKQQQIQPKKTIGIKPRKKVKTCSLIQEKDIV